MLQLGQSGTSYSLHFVALSCCCGVCRLRLDLKLDHMFVYSLGGVAQDMQGGMVYEASGDNFKI